jgi:hypothetical protein
MQECPTGYTPSSKTETAKDALAKLAELAETDATDFSDAVIELATCRLKQIRTRKAASPDG